MSERVETKIIDGKEAHVVVVALIEMNKSLVLLDRTHPIIGTSLIIGHVHKKESIIQTLEREVFEETGGTITGKEFVGTRVYDYGWKCTRGAERHEWHIFRAKIDVLRKTKIDEGIVRAVPFKKIAGQNLTPIVRTVLSELGYIT